MSTATKSLHNRIALAFDFDDTLAPDTVSSLIESCGMDADHFWQERVQPRVRDGWDPIPAAMYTLIAESRRRSDPAEKITRERLVDFGRNLTFFDGVPELFDRLRRRAQETLPDIEVEFYLITAGIVETARSSQIAQHFRAMWGCDSHYTESGEIDFLKRIVTHTEKTRYLSQISKGLDNHKEVGRPFDVNRSMAANDLHIPLSQIIYVGDGMTDVPCFSMLNEAQGVAIGVFKTRTAQKWGEQNQVSAGQRVENLAPVDYREGSELLHSLTIAVEMLCKQIALRRQSQGK
ncbi:MAG: HAD family hydrolase [Chloroflexaceae bacterium]